MRFFVAIVLFVVALASGGLGLAQRTVLAPPDAVTSDLQLSSTAPVTVIDGAALNAYEGSQTITITGGVEAPETTAAPAEPGDAAEGDAAEGDASEGDTAEGDAADVVTQTDAVAVTYGRTVDVIGWVGEAAYTLITLDAETGELVAQAVRGSENQVPSPLGSDLWFGEFEGDGDLGITLNVPADVSLLVVSDGTLPAPQSYTVTWPLDASTPYSGWLILGGIAFMVLGFGALLWALFHWRRQRGPRRKTPRMPKAPRPSRYRPTRPRAAIARPKGRRAIGRSMVVPALAISSALTLGACTADGVMTIGPSPTPSASEVVDEPVTPPIAVNERQLERIVARIGDRIAQADADLDAELAATRMAGPALELRQASYAIRAEDSDLGALPAIPVGNVEVALPQQTDIWPRTVFAVVEDADDETLPPLAMILIQDDPRSQYKVHYAVTVVPGNPFPDSPPASIGTARLPADTTLMSVIPQEIAPAYAELLLEGAEAEGAALFDLDSDVLIEQIGAGAKAERADSLPETAEIAFSNALGEGETIVLATADTGGLVTAYIIETETVTPIQDGAAVNASGAVQALSGVEQSTDGIVARYGVQLLFYVPPLGSDAPVLLLGYTQGLISASEVS
ncbi:hypothetical protein [Microcella sp.]|uniref:hypothetical protein n=1 Tax=Microcella sp. TaxID=1913979 RepID=UPI00391BAE3E